MESLKKSSIHEKGIFFDPKYGERDEFVSQALEHYQWKEFSKPPGSYCLDMVREFYMNMEGEHSNFTTVRGTQINFSPQAINKLYNLHEVDDKKTKEFMDDPLRSLDEMVNHLCYFGADWGYETNGDKSYLKAKNLKHETRPLLTFLSSRLLPNKNTSDVYLNRLTMLQAICSKMPLNVGKIINTQIMNCRYDPNAGSLWFPSTITSLITNSGVVPSSNSLHTSRKMITKSLWAKFAPSTELENKEREGDELFKFLATKFGSMENKFEEFKNEVGEIRTELVELKNNSKFIHDEMKELKEKNLELNRKLYRIEHIQMQDIIYSSSMKWDYSNFVQWACFSRYFEPTSFQPLHFVDPSSCSIPKFPSKWQFVTPPPAPPTENQPQTAPPTENQPQPTPLTQNQPHQPLHEPNVSDNGSATFSNFGDLSAILGTTNFAPTAEPRITEQDPESHSAKMRRIEKGKQVVAEEGESIYNWTPIPVTRFSTAQSKEYGNWFTDGHGGR